MPPAVSAWIRTSWILQIYDALIGKVPMQRPSIATTTDNLWCVPGNIDLTGAEIELVHEFAREHKTARSSAAHPE